ncbi:MAG: FumA C-terminus/TtdB family hydratase beta subunit [Candidatus Cloacimonetes bacterium]|nr:FumA C-terminus/TtdB family hydratase beta subunit [Candidatus Cloacimonadota bacterium]
MREIAITTPLNEEKIAGLRIGDKVLLSGIVYTARDKAHQKLIDLLNDNKELPFNLKDSIIYYCGPVFSEKSGKIISAGPTTSERMDRYTLQLLKAGVKGFIGKGRRSQEVIDLFREYQAVYFCAVGGAGVYLAKRITKYRLLAYPELGLEGIYELRVSEFPCYVAVDSFGDKLFR